MLWTPDLHVDVQSLSRVRFFATPLAAAGIPVLNYLPEFAQIHAHWVSCWDLNHKQDKVILKKWDFPGGPAVWTLLPTQGAQGSIPGQGTEIPNAATETCPAKFFFFFLKKQQHLTVSGGGQGYIC